MLLASLILFFNKYIFIKTPLKEHQNILDEGIQYHVDRQLLSLTFQTNLKILVGVLYFYSWPFTCQTVVKFTTNLHGRKQEMNIIITPYICLIYQLAGQPMIMMETLTYSHLAFQSDWLLFHQ